MIEIGETSANVLGAITAVLMFVAMLWNGTCCVLAYYDGRGSTSAVHCFAFVVAFAALVKLLLFGVLV